MILYHGSNMAIPRPDLLHSRDNVDFGRGFYTTPIEEQAVNWCGKFKRRHKAAVISCYQFDETAIGDLRVLEFAAYSGEWLDFVLKCRSGVDVREYDIVTGGVANDKVFNTIELFFDGLIDKMEAIKRLRYEQPNLQMCFKSEQALARLHFQWSKSV